MRGCAPCSAPSRRPTSSRRHSARRSSASRQLLRGHGRGPALVQLTGNDAAAARGVAARAFASLDAREIVLDARALPRDPGEIERVVQIWARETMLHGTGLYLDAHGLDETTESSPVLLFVENAPGPIVVGADRPLPFARRSAFTISIGKPTRAEQRDLWEHHLHGGARGVADSLAGQFDFSSDRIRAVGDTTGEDDVGKGSAWAAACASARAGLDRVAQRLDGRAAAEALVLPPLQRDALRDIVAHARNRSHVYEDWGMAERHGRGPRPERPLPRAERHRQDDGRRGDRRELDLDVYRVDLSQLVSKYIGETEKNLRSRISTPRKEAARSCCSTSATRSSASAARSKRPRPLRQLEVSYLLQRMEILSRRRDPDHQHAQRDRPGVHAPPAFRR